MVNFMNTGRSHGVRAKFAEGRRLEAEIEAKLGTLV